MTKCEVEKKIISNKSKTYLLPLLNKGVAIEFEYLLIDTYIKFNKYVGDIQYPIGLLYEWEESDAFINYDDYLREHELLFNFFDVYNNRKLYIYNFPEKYIKDYILFKEGKYSKFSPDAKAAIISYSAEAYKYPPLIEDITGVLWKHRTRRERLERELGVTLPKDSELASKIVFENETFRFEIPQT